MKPSSSDQRMSGPTSASPTVQPVRFDRDLHQGALGLGWGEDRARARIDAAVEAGRQQGLAAGYAEGWTQGHRAAVADLEREAAERARAEQAARHEAAARVQAVLAELGRAVQTAHETFLPAWQELADVLVDGALELARAAVDRELRLDGATEAAVRSALHRLGEAERVTVRLHPEDLARLSDPEVLHASGATAGIGQVSSGPLTPPNVGLVGDPAVTPGTVQVSSPVQQLTLDAAAALVTAREVMGR